MKQVTILVVALFLWVSAKNNGCHFSPSTVPAKNESIQQKYSMLQSFALELEGENIISVPAETFAKYMLCVFYAESNLKTSASWDGQQGINQLTASTRAKLGLPADISKDDFKTQLGYFKVYLVATKKGQKIKTVYDLHLLNFAPAKIGQTDICGVSGNLKYLDKDKDGRVTTADLKIFICKRVKENIFIKKIFDSIS